MSLNISLQIQINMLRFPGHFSLMFVILVHVLIAKTLAYATHSHYTLE